MQRVGALLAAVLLVFICHTAHAEMDVAELKCEYRSTPMGLETSHPRLSWILEADERGQRQSAYRVIVSTSAQKLRENTGDLWDTGKVESDASVNVPYGGQPLESGMRCWWKVRVWGKDGEPGPWSKPSWWEMGLVEEGAWEARWIRPPTSQDPDAEPDPAPLFRKEFQTEKRIARARAYISGLGYYELFLNGEKLGDHVLDPAFTRYDRRVLYETYDVTDTVRQGKNVAGAVLGNGWYNMHTRATWNFDRAPWRDRPVLICQLHLTFEDGSTRTIMSDGSWRVSTGPTRFDGIRNGEVYDAREEKPGWRTSDYDASGWKQAVPVDGPGGRLVSQTMHPVRVTETLEPVKITEAQPGHYVFDFGQNMSGWARLRVSGPRGREVKMRYGERLNEDGTVSQEMIGKFVKEGEFQTDTYILDGNGTETWEPGFSYHGFRYVEVTGFPGEPNEESLQARVVHTDAPRAGTFRCSNDMFNRLQHCGLWAYKSNYVGYPTDCPQREKNGWTGDAQLAVEQAMYNWSMTPAYEKWIRDFRDVQRPSGQLPTIVPTGGWGYDFLGQAHPAWDTALLLIPWHLYQYKGDSRVLARNYDVMESYVEYMGARAEDHIIREGIGDWVPADTETPTPLTSTAYYYEAANLMSRIARLLDRGDDEAAYGELAADIKEAYNEEFYRGEGTYANGSQTAQSCALYFGLCPEGERQEVLEKLIDAVEKSDRHIDTGILGAKFLFYVLTRNGHADLAYDVANQKTQPGYGYWIEQGATTMWEHWSGESGSLNHIMLGDIIAWFYRSLAGIRIDPDRPAFKRLVIKPHLLGELKWVTATHTSPYGTIRSEWERADGQLRLIVSVPANTTATVHVPAAADAEVREGGRKASSATAVSLVRRTTDRAIYRVGSGDYTFTSAVPGR